MDGRTDGQMDGRSDGRSGPTTRAAFAKATQVKSKWNMVETRLPYGPVNVILQLK